MTRRDGGHSLVATTFGRPAAWLRKAEVAVLLRAFARAFGVEAPSLAGRSAAESLRVYREFTAACMEIALEDERPATFLRARLGAEALSLGRTLQRLLCVRRSRVLAVARFFYRGIGIELAGELPGKLRFGPCSFARRYTPRDCWLMQAFDEGFLRGLMGDERATLSFSCRLTQGAPCCRATMATDPAAGE